MSYDSQLSTPRPFFHSQGIYLLRPSHAINAGDRDNRYAPLVSVGRRRQQSHSCKAFFVLRREDAPAGRQPNNRVGIGGVGGRTPEWCLAGAWVWAAGNATVSRNSYTIGDVSFASLSSKCLLHKYSRGLPAMETSLAVPESVSRPKHPYF